MQSATTSHLLSQSNIQLPGNHSNTSQTPSDRVIATVAPALNTGSALPGDPLSDRQWSFFDSSQYKGASALFAAREHTSGNFPVVVAVVDSGVFSGHEDLELLPGFDFISDKRVANDGDGRDNDASDPGDWVTTEEIANNAVSSGCAPTRSKWHGTAVSGIIGAVSNNQRGISGGAASVLLVPVRVTGKCGGYIRDLVDGVRWAAGLPVAGVPNNDYPARVINLSVGFPGSCPDSLQNAIDAAVNTGAAVVVAATNSAVVLDTDPQSPASCSNVTTVGALQRDGSLAAYSATGSALTLLAPGGSVNDGILTTQNISDTSPADESSYGHHFGTSMAAAHVSAAYATLLSIEPALTNNKLQQLISQSASGSAAISGCSEQLCGAGRLNAKGAVDLLLEQPATLLSADQIQDTGLSVSSASSSATPPVSAASDASAIAPDNAAANLSTPASPQYTGTGRFGLPTITLLFALTLIRKRGKPVR